LNGILSHIPNADFLGELADKVDPNLGAIVRTVTDGAFDVLGGTSISDIIPFSGGISGMLDATTGGITSAIGGIGSTITGGIFGDETQSSVRTGNDKPWVSPDG